jgi:hypothetical protein
MATQDTREFRTFFGSQGQIANKARDSVYTPLRVLPIEESHCVALTADPKRLRMLMKRTNCIMGLLDEHDAPQLLDSLWEHAGRQISTFRPFPKPPWLTMTVSSDEIDPGTIEEGINKIADYMSDRKNWTQWNLSTKRDCIQTQASTLVAAWFQMLRVIGSQSWSLPQGSYIIVRAMEGGFMAFRHSRKCRSTLHAST